MKIAESLKNIVEIAKKINFSNQNQSSSQAPGLLSKEKRKTNGLATNNLHFLRKKQKETQSHRIHVWFVYVKLVDF